MVGKDKIASQKAVQLDGIETLGTGICPYCMHDEIDVVGKLLDFRMVPVGTAVFDRQRMKVKDVEENLIVRFRGRFDVSPEHEPVIFKQLRNMLHGEPFFHPVRTFTINQNVHMVALLSGQTSLCSWEV